MGDIMDQGAVVNQGHNMVESDNVIGLGTVTQSLVVVLRLVLVLLATFALRYTIVRFHSGFVSFEACVFTMCLLVIAVWIIAMLAGFSVLRASAIVGIIILASVVDGLSNKSADILTVGASAGIPPWIIHIYDVVSEANLSMLSMVIGLISIVTLGASLGWLAVLIYATSLDLFIIPFRGIISDQQINWMDATSLTNPASQAYNLVFALAIGIVSRLLWVRFLRYYRHRQMYYR